MGGATIFTTLDLTKGYHQNKLAKAFKEITAFTSPKSLYQLKVLPMGMKTSGQCLTFNGLDAWEFTT